MLTAAHCLYDKGTGAPVDVGTLVFRAGLRDGAAVAEGPVLRAVAHPGFDPAEGTSRDSVRHDVALLQLARPIPSAIAAPFVVQPPGRVRRVSVVSYARGRDAALSWQRTCGVVGHQDGLPAFDCDVDFGSSGAPVFDRAQGRARIVSIISAGGESDAGDNIAFGMELPALLSDLKAALRSGRGVMSAMGATPPVVRRTGSGDTSRDIGARFVRP